MIATHSGIREATAADVDALMGLCMRFASESVYADRLAAHEPSVRKTCEWLIGGAGVVFLAEKDDQPVGMMGLAVFPHFLSGQLYGAEVFWWCNPEARGYGLKLLRRGEQWVRDKGAAFMQLTAPTDDIERLYARLGYARIETVYSKDLLC